MLILSLERDTHPARDFARNLGGLRSGRLCGPDSWEDAAERDVLEEGLIQILTPHLLEAPPKMGDVASLIGEVRCWCAAPATRFWQEINGQAGCCEACAQDAMREYEKRYKHDG